ncbi:esterase/lipase family protein [Lysobacter terrae]
MKMLAPSQQLYRPGAARFLLRRMGAALRLLGVFDSDGDAGLYLSEPFDPTRRVVVMIHGLGGDALTWARLTQAVQGNAELRAGFQVWHLVYNSNAPTLVIRRRAQNYLDEAWRELDPEGQAPARSGMVLVGHSLGGVVARMLCVESGDSIWTVVFTVGPQQLQHEAAGLVDAVFRFRPYPGVGRAIFMGAPHRGSPNADNWFGRAFRNLMGDSTDEIRVLRALVREHPELVQADLLETYRQGKLNSISTLQVSQPVRRAGESLLPNGIPYHVIAGELPGAEPPGDGVVPLTSALLPGAASTLIVHGGHDLCDNDAAVAEILRILREDAVSTQISSPR